MMKNELEIINLNKQFKDVKALNNINYTFHNGIYDVVNNLFEDNILDYDIDYLKGKFEIFGFIKMGIRLKKNIFKILYYYVKGKIKEKKYFEILANKQDKVFRSNKMKILIVAHPYVVYDEYLCGNIIHYFKDEDIVEQEDIKWKYGEEQLSLTIESLLRLGIINGITYDNRDDVAYALTDFGKLFRDLCLMTPTDIEQDEFVFQDEQNNAYISGKYAFSDTFGTVRKSEKNGHLYIRHKFSIEDVDNGSQIAVVFRVYNNYSEEKSLERVYLESQRGKIYAAENKMPVTIKPKKFFDCIFAIKSKQMLEELESGNGKYVIQEGKMIYEMSVTEATRREIAVYLKYFKEDN